MFSDKLSLSSRRLKLTKFRVLGDEGRRKLFATYRYLATVEASICRIAAALNPQREVARVALPRGCSCEILAFFLIILLHWYFFSHIKMFFFCLFQFVPPQKIHFTSPEDTIHVSLSSKIEITRLTTSSLAFILTRVFRAWLNVGESTDRFWTKQPMATTHLESSCLQPFPFIRLWEDNRFSGIFHNEIFLENTQPALFGSCLCVRFVKHLWRRCACRWMRRFSVS